MRRWLLAIIVGSFLVRGAAHADDDRYIVRLRAEATDARRDGAIRALGAVGLQQIDHIPDDNAVVVRLRPEDLFTLAARPDVERVERDGQVRAFLTTNDPFLGQQYSLQGSFSSHVTDAWDTSIGSSEALVAVIDTGADLTHPDLEGSLWTNPREIAGNGRDDDRNGFVDDLHGYDFANRDGDPQDDNGHGTHVTGIVAAVGDNATGVAGVAWGTKVVVVKALRSDGSGFTSELVKSIDYITNLKKRGVPIIAMNLSLGGSSYSSTLLRAIVRARNRDILMIAAAGNSGANNDQTGSYPANFKLDSVVSVGATDSSGQLAGYSNFGPTSVHLAAPGSEILSTFPIAAGLGPVGELSGTSMASPHVAGIIALAAAANPSLSALQLRSILLSTTQPFSSLSGRVITGGLSDANSAVASAVGTQGLPRLTGVVRDSRRKAISGARVQIRSRVTPSVRRVVTTTTDGSYSVSQVQPDRYVVSVRKRGHTFRNASLMASVPGVIRRNFTAR